jgi:hypothetical protein
VKNLPALALALVCTTAALVSNNATAASASIKYSGATPFSSAGGTFALLGGAANPAVTDILLNPNFTPETTDDKKAVDANFGAVLSVSQDALSAVTTASSLELKAAGGESSVLRVGTFGYTGVDSTATFSFDYSFMDDTKNRPLVSLYASLDRYAADGTTLLQNLIPNTTPLLEFIGNDVSDKFALNFDVKNGEQYFLTIYLSASSDVAAAPVPVPAALPLLIGALAGVAGMSKRRRNKGAQV